MDTVLLVILLILAVLILIKLGDIKSTLRCIPFLEERLDNIEKHLKPSAPRSEPPPTTLPLKPPPVQPPPPPPIPQQAATGASSQPVPAVIHDSQFTVHAPSPHTRPAWVESATAILNRIWQWILVGEEFRPKGVAMEFAVATTWLVRVGIVALVACVAYFLKWSIQRELIGPAARVAISIAFGLGILVAGRRLLGKRYHIIGQAFMGGGFATLYFSMYALGPLYHLVTSQALVFGFMILVTLSAGILALESKSMLVAIFGIIGGFCTPIMLSTGTPNFPALYSYLLILNFGILAISLLRSWRLLNYLGFIFTYGIYLGSLSQYQRSDFPVVITFLSLFFIVQSTLVFIYNMRRRIPCTVLEIIHLTLNAGIYSLAGYHLIRGAVGRPYPAILALGLAIYFVAHVAIFLRLKLSDRPLLLAAMSLAVLYAALTMPLVLEQESLTIAWALQAYLFLRLGRCMDNRFLRHLGYALYGATAIRLVCFEFPRFETPGIIAPETMQAYWSAMSGRLWTFGAVIASLVAAFRLERRYLAAEEGKPASDVPDIPAGIPASITSHAFFWSVTAALFLYLHFELYAMFAYLPPWRLPVLTGLWCAMAVFFILFHRATGAVAALAAGLFFAAGAIAKTLFLDFDSLNLCHNGYFNTPYLWPGAFARIMDFACVVAICVMGAAVLRQGSRYRAIPAIFGYSSLALLWLYGTLEIATILHWKLPAFQKGGVSMWWTVFAFAMLAGGIWKNTRPIRYAALLLFTVVIIKIFFMDLARMPIIYRVAALMVLGVLLLLGAFAYLRAGKRFTSAALLILLLGATTHAATATGLFPMEKTLSTRAERHSEVGRWIMDADLFDALDSVCGNLRLFAPDGRETPFLLRNKADTRSVVSFTPVSVSSSVESLRQLADNRVELIVTRKASEPPVAGIQLESGIRNFEKLVSVYGGTDRVAWATLVEAAPIYDYSRFIDLRRDRVSFAPSSYTVYRIEISNMTEKQDSPLVEIIRQTRGTETPTETEATAFRREPFRIEQIRFLERRESIVSDASETAEADVGGFKVEHDAKALTTLITFTTRRQPVTAVTLLTDDSNFSRAAAVEAETETTPRTWRTLSQGTLSRIHVGGTRQEQLTLPLSATRYKTYRVVIRDMDNPPLAITGAKIRHNQMEGLFFPKNLTPHRLCYGGQDIPAPVYDVASVLSRVVPESVQLWQAGEERPNPDFAKTCAFRLCSGKTGMTAALIAMAVILLVLVSRLARKIESA